MELVRSGGGRDPPDRIFGEVGMAGVVEGERDIVWPPWMTARRWPFRASYASVSLPAGCVRYLPAAGEADGPVAVPSMAAATRSAAALSSWSGTLGSTSSQSGSIIPCASTMPSGRGMNQTWKCAPPSPHRYRCTRAVPPRDRMARSTRAAIIPKSAAAAEGRSQNESTWSREASHTEPGKLPPTGGCRVHRSSDHTADVTALVQMAHGSPPGSPRRGGSGMRRSDSSTGIRGSEYGSLMAIILSARQYQSGQPAALGRPGPHERYGRDILRPSQGGRLPRCVARRTRNGTPLDPADARPRWSPAPGPGSSDAPGCVTQDNPNAVSERATPIQHAGQYPRRRPQPAINILPHDELSVRFHRLARRSPPACILEPYACGA